MTAKEFLSRGKDISTRIARVEERRRTAFYRATSITTRISNTPRGGDSEPKQERYMIELEKLDALYRGNLSELYALQAEIKGVISQLLDKTQREVIECRHVDGYTLEKTAVKLNISYPQICRIQGRAYLEIEKIINN